MSDKPINDLHIIQRLRSQIEQLENLEKRINTLEQERSTLTHTTECLQAELIRHQQIKADWEWFFENSLDLLCIAALDGYFKRVNPAFAATLGFTQNELLAKPITELIHPDDLEITVQALQGLGSGQDCINFENRYIDNQGQWHWLSWRCPALSENTSQLYAIARDVTDYKRSTAEIMYQATHDPLTDLYNRAAFDNELNNCLLRAQRHPTNHVALLLIDLDDFKQVNDSYGHQTGDQLLQALAQRFKNMQRKNDFVCRLGGDEFAWLAEANNIIAVEALLARILKELQKPVPLEKVTLKVSCSIGASLFPNLAQDAKTLFHQADSSMYQIKRSGKGGCFIYHSSIDA